jgi:ubiquinone/menaquinone biosynthesis C-methylase UbiE
MTTLTSEEAVKWLRSQPNSEQVIRDCYFDESVTQAAHRFWGSDEFRAVLSILRGRRPFLRVLDLGAGRGVASFAFAQETLDVIAVEPDTSPIAGTGAIREIVDKTTVPIKIVGGYGEHLPFRNDTFDIVYTRQVLHHTENLKQVCKEIYRVLSLDGLFLATREHVLSKKDDLRVFQENHLFHHLTRNEQAFLLPEYTEAITNAGFSLTNIWGSYDSVINYFPCTKARVKDMAASVLKPYVPGRVLRPFMDIPTILRLCSRRCSQNDNTPGRMYSFLAIKT